MVNKKGNIGMAVIFAIFIFIIGMTTINILMPEITLFRGEMNCDNAAVISDATKLTCLVGDATIPYFIVLVFSLAGGFIFDKLAI